MDANVVNTYRALNEAQNEIRRAETLDQALQSGLRILLRGCDAESAAIWYVDATDHCLHPYFWIGSSDLTSCVHALGEGVLCYEIQQSSDVTYRFYDWGRVGANGQPRELHIEKGLDVCKPELDLDRIEGTTALCKGGSRTYYISDTNFELCRLNLAGTMPLESGRMLFLTPMSGCTLRWDGGEMALNPFDSVLVPAALQGVALAGETKVLMSSLPDRPKLIEELGYRAENVAGLLD